MANPLRGVEGDADYVRDVIGGIGRPVVLVGHSYGGMVITQAVGVILTTGRIGGEDVPG
ncbi:alpha/beta hydrolase [Spongiactinospora sp. TRM90649]|nr:alpha/beta hydrolase [Spongiactinospora sp. TRM90649]MDF5758663.1 alpha/beta hydrolase [Spongiactinospora sp. TRM90649]